MTLLMRDQENIEKGIQQGIEQGIEQGVEQVILNMHKNGFSVEQIANAVEKSVEDVQGIIMRKEFVLV